MQLNTETEKKIIAAAREVFIRQGREGARMQEIAEKAGVNKALLHYYFRSKEKLYRKILQDAVTGLMERLLAIPAGGSFRDFLVRLAGIHIDFLKENKDLIHFVLWELKEGESVFLDTLHNVLVDEQSGLLQFWQKKYDEAVSRGEIRPVGLVHIILSLVSMNIFPIVARSMVQKIFHLNEHQYLQLLEERKEINVAIIWSYICRQETSGEG